jgi:AMP-binding enzyme C-terminal domain
VSGSGLASASASASASAEEIISWSRERLAHFKCPKTMEFADSLPRTTTGKVLKRELRAQLAAARDGQTERGEHDTSGAESGSRERTYGCTDGSQRTSPEVHR